MSKLVITVLDLVVVAVDLVAERDHGLSGASLTHSNFNVSTTLSHEFKFHEFTVFYVKKFF